MRYGHLSESDQRIHQSRCQCQSQLAQRIQTKLHPLLKLQQTICNRAVGGLIQAKGKFNPPSAAGGRRIRRVCTECEHETRQREEMKEKGTESLDRPRVQRQVDEETEEEQGP